MPLKRPRSGAVNAKEKRTLSFTITEQFTQDDFSKARNKSQTMQTFPGLSYDAFGKPDRQIVQVISLQPLTLSRPSDPACKLNGFDIH